MKKLLIACIISLFSCSALADMNWGAAPTSALVPESNANGQLVNSALTNDATGGAVQIHGAAPAVGSGAGACGTSASVVGNNSVGVVTVGSSTNGGVCTVTFSGSFSYAHAPICFGEDLTAAATRLVAVTSTVNTVVLTAVTTFTAADTIEYFCIGYN